MTAPATTWSHDKATQPSWLEFLSVQKEQEFSDLCGKEGEDAGCPKEHVSSVMLHPNLLLPALELGDGVRARALALHLLGMTRAKPEEDDQDNLAMALHNHFLFLWGVELGMAVPTPFSNTSQDPVMKARMNAAVSLVSKSSGASKAKPSGMKSPPSGVQNMATRDHPKRSLPT